MEVVETVLRNFYVDDCLKSVESEELAVKLVHDLRRLLKEGGFNLTKWVTNRSSILSDIQKSRRLSKPSVMLHDEHGAIDRALGVRWSTEADKVCFSTMIKPRPLTRRGLLSVINSIYDPLGLLGPFILPAKRILQELCRQKIHWDDALPENELIAWNRWRGDLAKLQLLSVDRCIRIEGTVKTVQIHHFCDASSYAYGVATYARVSYDNGHVTSRLLLSRSRLAPLRVMTIPRLELSAAVLAVKVHLLVQSEFDMQIDDTVFWTDSTIVIQYISNESRRFHTFVANKVAYICENTRLYQWRHVDSAQNPADDVSRGLTADQLMDNKRWFNGPRFLLQPSCNWPANHICCDLPEDSEKKQSAVVYATNIDLSEIAESVSDVMKRLFQRYSCLYKLKLTVVYLLRTKQVILSKVKQQSVLDITRTVSLLELQTAESEIVKYVQREVFSDELVTSVKTKKPVSQLAKLEPVLINDTLCIGGRLQIHQKILPTKHPVVTLIIRHYHRLACHAGREHVLSLVRQYYWIIKGRSAVRFVLGNCTVCKRLKSKPLVQKMADLPTIRTTPNEPPFSHVGLDVFGYFLVKQGRSQVKRYGCIFTCLLIRAVHIEILQSMETDSFIQALQRFICRRGQVLTIYCDNGPNFVGAANELQRELDKLNNKKISDFLQQRSIEWKFNPPAASHMGGVWERQIRTVRKILSTLLREQVLDDERLNTFMCLAESVINSRPITTVSDDCKDPEALTPNHLLLLRQTSLPVVNGINEKDLYSRKRYRQVLYLADVFWRIWLREYLPAIQLRQKWLETNQNLKCGDVVIMTDEKKPRNCWPLGRVVEVMPSSDGLIRTVKLSVKTSDSDQLKELVRPIHKLCLLESI